MKKKRFLLPLLLAIVNIGFAQNEMDTSLRRQLDESKVMQEFQVQSLFLLGKVWGFLKYYHPSIAAGKYNWDIELIHFLPEYCSTKSKEERDRSLQTWLGRFGEVSACSDCTDTLLQNAKLVPDFSWINNQNFSPAIVNKLQWIRSNRIRDSLYYIKAIGSDGVNLIQFAHEPAYGKIVFPNDGYALLALFRFWNAIEYWYPYKYDLPKPWDDVLKETIPKMLHHQNAYHYTIALEELITAIRDGHGFFQSPVTNETIGKYYMPFTVKMVEGKLLVTSILNDSLAAIADVKAGDIIKAVDGIEIALLVKKATLTLPASNHSSLLDKMSYRLTRTNNPQSLLRIDRNGVNIETSISNTVFNLFNPPNLKPAVFTYQKDSAFCIIDDSIGYINVGLFKRNDSLLLKQMVSRVSKLIIDLRQNQDESHGTGGGDIIASLIMPEENAFAMFSSARPDYPGVFRLTPPTNMGITGSANNFSGDIILLINENAISVGEFLTMAYQTAPRARTLGTQTAGADGNITYIPLPGNFIAVFTGLGVYYPDGRETQRVGIKPDIVVEQTINGYRNNEDEQLKKAIEILKK